MNQRTASVGGTVVALPARSSASGRACKALLKKIDRPKAHKRHF